MARQPIAQPTFSFETLRAISATAEAKALFTEIMKELKQEVERVERSTDMDSFCIRAFKRAGIENVRPREDVLTYGKWVEQGFKVKQGEKSVRVKNLRLFHRSQVEPITKAEQAEYLAKREAKTADKLPAVSPVTPITAAPKAAKKTKAQPQPAAA